MASKIGNTMYLSSEDVMEGLAASHVLEIPKDCTKLAFSSEALEYFKDLEGDLNDEEEVL
ncbi:MAG TPA: hypothetical protein VGF75_02040 [Candidatus Saccharimonadales bacterium]|jgi:hypothetical protein